MVEIWHLKDIDWLKGLPRNVLEKLTARAELNDYAPGAVIFTPSPDPDDVFVLVSGLVRIYRTSPRGEEVTFGYIHSGEAFGELAAFSDGPRESFAAAVEPSQVMRVPRDDFVMAIQTRSSVVFSIARQIEGRFKQIESRVEDLAFRSVISRVAHMLLQLAAEFGDGAEVPTIGLRLTHADLAMLIGASRPTVSLALGELEDIGVVGRANSLFVLTDRERLGEIALGNGSGAASAAGSTSDAS